MYQGECAKVYEMCGGYDYEKKCCEAGSTCYEFNEYHHQCIPDAAIEYLNTNAE